VGWFDGVRVDAIGVITNGQSKNYLPINFGSQY
jgi:hypothetical protein